MRVRRRHVGAAIANIYSITLRCPNCNERVTMVNGQDTFRPYEDLRRGDVIECRECKWKSRAPAWVFRHAVGT